MKRDVTKDTEKKYEMEGQMMRGVAWEQDSGYPCKKKKGPSVKLSLSDFVILPFLGLRYSTKPSGVPLFCSTTRSFFALVLTISAHYCLRAWNRLKGSLIIGFTLATTSEVSEKTRRNLINPSTEPLP